MDVSSLRNALPTTADNNRIEKLKAFEATRAGVKGLVDAGIKKIPTIFIRPADELAEESNLTQSDIQVPLIDLQGIQLHDQREKIVGQVRKASKEWGFFTIVNHGIPQNVMDDMLDGIKKFHEQTVEAKQVFYSRGEFQKVGYSSNVDLYRSRAANWRDTLTINLLRSERVEPQELPEICRDSTIKYIDEMAKLGETLLELLSEALGLERDRLGAMECGRGRLFVGHYYPPCPEPELTLGTSKHTDPSFLTILLQDQIGGLQVLHSNHYVNVPPAPGSLVINIGDMLQIISNDEFVSTDHRVLANRSGPRISVAGFLNGAVSSGRTYGLIKEVISESNPARYREFTVTEYVSKFLSRSLDKSGLEDFKLEI